MQSETSPWLVPQLLINQEAGLTISRENYVHFRVLSRHNNCPWQTRFFFFLPSVPRVASLPTLLILRLFKPLTLLLYFSVTNILSALIRRRVSFSVQWKANSEGWENKWNTVFIQFAFKVCRPWHFFHKETLTVCVWGGVCRDAWSTENREKEREGVLYRSYASVCNAEVCDDSPKVTESFSSFPLFASSSWHPPGSQRFFYLHGLFLHVPWGAVVCGGTMSECWLRCFMWRWTLFSSVVCCSPTLEGHLNAGGQRSCNALGGEITLVARSRGILFCMLREQSILKFHGANGILMSCVAPTLSCRYRLVKECVLQVIRCLCL